MDRTAAVIGAGAGGRALAIALSLKGFQVTICERFPQRAAGIKEDGIVYYGVLGQGVVRVCVVDSPVEASRRGGLIFLATTAHGEEWAASSLAASGPLESPVVFLSGYMGSLLGLRSFGPDSASWIGETSAFPFSARIDSTGKVCVRRAFRPRFSCVISSYTPRLMSLLTPILDLVPGVSIFETALSNPNPMLHSVSMLLNFGLIERHGFDVEVPAEGLTPRSIKLIEAIDRERQLLGSAFGCHLPSIDALYAELAGRPPRFRQDDMMHSEPLQPRFLLEDVPYGLSLWVSLADLAEIDVPFMRSILRIFACLDPSLSREQRTLSSLGLDHFTLLQLRGHLSGQCG